MFDRFWFWLCLWRLVGVFADSDAVKSVSVMEGDSVSLQTHTELQTNDRIIWTFGLSEARIAQINKQAGRFSTYDGPDRRFRDRLKLDHQTGSLTITNTRTTDSGLYQVTIFGGRTDTSYRFNVTVSGVFADSDAVKSVSVMEGDSVTLQTHTELQTEDLITWTFGLSETRIAQINKDTGRFSTYDALDGRFRDRLKLDHQTGSLTITNTRTTDSGLYHVTISSRTDTTYRFSVTVSGTTKGGTEGNSGGGRTPGRRTANRVQGGVDGERSQGGDRRSQGGPDGGRRQEGLGAGRARWDPGHSHEGDPRWSRWREEPWWRKGGPTDGGGASGGGARGGDGEPMNQGDGEDLEDQGGADGSGDRGGDGDPEGRGGAGATEDRVGAEGKEEPDRAGGTEGRGAAGRVESRGDGWLTIDQGGAEGMREPGGAGGLTGHSG
ncbi:uncharacterized protein LOC131530974 [Onychostoma macrolepis]|uniref:uncharacterized protein LOC131530974 n=1 Tax=Onychostoma macrolepis TaxID=369639 RepID=UPI00272AA1DB|nr:uncharacterized protein LOC131530974 [Onychostoma macrolepis]